MSNNKSSFTPPLFGSFGKKAKDLFKKKYDFENQATLINKGAGGLNLETKVVASNEAPLRGVFKSSVPVTTLGKCNGVFESEFHTVADRESKTSYKFNSLAKGVALKLGLTGVKAEVKGETPDFPEGWASIEAEYAQEYVSASAAVRSNGAKTLADVVIALGYDNLSVGAKATIDAASRQPPSDYNFGAELVGADYVVTASTEKKRTQLNLQYYQAVSKKQNVGAVATFGLVKPTRTLQFGTEYRVDVDTEVRSYVKVDSSKDTATMGLAVEHRLLNPSMLLGVATEYNITPQAVQTGKFGVSLTFGDF